VTIAPGTKLGRYEIRSKIGEGGWANSSLVFLLPFSGFGQLDFTAASSNTNAA